MGPFRGQSDFRRQEDFLLVGNNVGALALLADLSALLRRVVFIGDPAVCHRLDLERVGLGAYLELRLRILMNTAHWPEKSPAFPEIDIRPVTRSIPITRGPMR